MTHHVDTRGGAVSVFAGAAVMLTDAVANAIVGAADLADNSVTKMVQWSERSAQRRHLAELDDHLLSDIGVDRKQVEKETKKPFWAR